MLRHADIDEHWNMVKEGLEAIMRKSPFDCSLVKLRADIRLGRLRLLIDPPKPGFLIVELRMQPEPHLFIWMAWSAQGENLMAECLPELEEMALQVGAKYLEMQSKRRGYERTGWTINDIIYRKDL
jgi:hypothetical protein